MVRNALFLVLLAVVWLLWSGLTIEIHPNQSPVVGFEGLMVLFMAGSLALVFYLSQRMDAVDHESHPIELGPRPPAYLVWLIKEIIVSNLHVARVILDRDLPIHPRLVRVHTTQQTDLGLVVHANSITITPGTVSLDVRDGTILVHALTDTTAEGVLSGEMDRKVTWLEGPR